MAGSQLDPAAWKCKLHECSQKWASLGPLERDRYAASALAEQALKEDAAHDVFPSKHALSMKDGDGQRRDAAVDQLPRNAACSISKHRFLATYANFKSREEWVQLDGGLCSPDGALDLDKIDLDATDEAVDEIWGKFAEPVRGLHEDWNQHQDAAVHHTVCLSEQGFCVSSLSAEKMAKVTKFVQSMGDHVSAGDLSCFSIKAMVIVAFLLNGHLI